MGLRERVRRERERAGPVAPRPIFFAFLLAALLLSIANAITIEIAPVRFPGLGLRLLHHLTDLAENIAVGVSAGAFVAALYRYAPRLTLPLTTLATGAIVHTTSSHTIWRKIMIWWDGAVEWSVFWPIVAVAAIGGPVSFALGHWLGSFRRAWLVAPILALVSTILGNRVQVDSYFGDHGVIACATTLLGGAAITRRFDLRLAKLENRRLAYVVAPFVVLGLWPPSNAVRIELFRVPTSVSAWVLATTIWTSPATNATVAITPTPWLAGRSGDAPIAPNPRTLVADNPVIVLLTIDATRGDVVNGSSALPISSRPNLPELASMRTNGVQFTNALAPGAQTTLSLTTLFSGRYYSQLQWDWVGRGAKRFIYPAPDPSVRFPEILTKGGVSTTMVGPIVFLNAEYGIVRGFSDHHVVVQDTSHAMGEDVVNALVERIRKVDQNKPAFFYGHIVEPHHPYDRGSKKEGTDFERYVSEIELADRLVARVARALETRFGMRGLLIVASDHGEAFGEHNSFQHSKMVYQEVLRVPLLVRGGQIRPHQVEERVGIIDLGPTILDLFGFPTPPAFMGQSLVPLLEGKSVHLDRPIFAEARLRRAYFGEVKVIADVRRKTVEAYDLTRDPTELDNLYGRDPRVEPAFAVLQTFFKDAPTIYRQ